MSVVALQPSLPAPTRRRSGIMRRLTLRNLWSHKGRLLACFVSVMLGVSFFVGVNVFTNSLRNVFDDLFTRNYAGVDAQVRGKQTIEGNSPYDDGRAKVPSALIAKILEVDGVAATTGDISGKAQIINKKGKLVGNGNAPTFGNLWTTDKELNPFVLFSGRAPQADDEIVIDRASAKDAKISNGDVIKVSTNAGTSPYRVVGEATFGSSDGALGSTSVFFTQTTAERVLRSPGTVDSVFIRAKPGISQTEIARRVAVATKGTGFETVTGAKLTEENKNIFGTFFGYLSTFLNAFALVAIFVSIFVIYNAFSIVAAQRTRETALLRAVGASGRQVLRSSIAESLIVGSVASLLGIPVGLVLALLLQGLIGLIGGSLPSSGLVITPGVVIGAMLIGIIVTVVSSLVPAWRSSRIPPMAAMREVAVDRSGTSRLRLAAGSILMAAGIALLIYGWGLKGGDGATIIGLAAAATLLGVIVLGPVLAVPLARAVGTRWYGGIVTVFGALFTLAGVASLAFAVSRIDVGSIGAGILSLLFIGATLLQILIGVYLVRTGIGAFHIEGRVARRNAMRNPSRTASTALALTIGVSLVSFLLVFSTSLQNTLLGSIDRQLKADHIITSTDGDGFFPTVAADIAKVQGVQQVLPIRLEEAKVSGKAHTFVSVDPKTFTSLINVGKIDGSLDRLAESNTMAIARRTAISRFYRIGQKLDVSFTGGKTVPLKIVAIYDEPLLENFYYLTGSSTFAKYSTRASDSFVVVKTDGRKGFQQAGEDAIADVKNAKLLTKKGYKNSIIGQLAQILGLISALLLLAIVIAVLGIANTLILSIYERTRELGLLRAVGMERRQVRSAVRWEAIVVATIGALFGLAIGAVFGAGLVHVLSKDGSIKLSMPTAQLIGVALLASVVGLIAARKPAKRAARLNLLEAIATD